MRLILGVLWGYYIRGSKLADNYAYGVYGACAHVRCGASRNRSFHAWPIRNA